MSSKLLSRASNVHVPRILCVVVNDYPKYAHLFQPLLQDGLLSGIRVGSQAEDFADLVAPPQTTGICPSPPLDSKLILLLGGKGTGSVLKAFCSAPSSSLSSSSESGFHPLSNVEWIHTHTTGVDCLELPITAQQQPLLRRIPISNARGMFREALAEHVLLSMLYFNRNVPKMVRDKERRVWDKTLTPMLKGQKVGIIGYGDIGRCCAQRALQFGMCPTGYRRSQPPNNASVPVVLGDSQTLPPMESITRTTALEGSSSSSSCSVLSSNKIMTDVAMREPTQHTVVGDSGPSLPQPQRGMDGAYIDVDTHVTVHTSPSALLHILCESDYVLNLLPHTPSTYHFFDRNKFSAMKANSVFINIGRGQTVVEQDLVDALTDNGGNDKCGHLKGAALDVYETEPLPTTSPLYDVPSHKILMTPHNADHTSTATEESLEQFITLFKEFVCCGKLPPYLVSVEKGY